VKKLWFLLLIVAAAHAQITYPGTIKKADQYSWPYYSKAGSAYTISGASPLTTPAGVPVIPCQTPSGGIATTPTNCLPGINGRAITGTTATDTILATDCNPYRVEYKGSVAVAITLPTATTFGVSKCSFKLVNNLSTVNDLTITTTTWTCNGNATCVIHNGQEGIFFTDPNSATNWVADIHEQALTLTTTGSGASTLTRAATGITLNVPTPNQKTSVANTTPVTASANTTGAQALMELSLGAGLLNTLNAPVKLHGSGIYSTALGQTPTLTFVVKLCTVSGCGSGTVVTLASIITTATVASITNNGWSINLVAVPNVVGSSGTLLVHGPLTIDLGALTTTADSVFNDVNTAASSTINLTSALFLDFFVTTSTGSASNSITQQIGGVMLWL